MMSSMTALPAGMGKRDAAIAVVLCALGVIQMIANVNDDEIAASVLAVPLFLAVTAPVAWRRVAPVTALAVATAALLAHIALFGEVIRCGTALPLAFVFAFTIGARLDTREACIGLAGVLAFVVAVVVSDAADDIISGLPFIAVIAAAFWGAGRLLHARGRLTSELSKRTSDLRAARDERAKLEVATDRARLSGELDELLRRRLATLTRLADGGAHPEDPVAATATLVEIEQESRRTLEEMRELVGVLREDSGAPTAPAPTLTQLEALLLRDKGADARLTVAGSPRVLPAGVELSAYRIVEHLLAAVEDAPDVVVGLRFSDSAIEITVSGPARRRGRSAIDQARERVALHRGTLTTSLSGGRAEAVVSLPVLAGG